MPGGMKVQRRKRSCASEREVGSRHWHTTLVRGRRETTRSSKSREGTTGATDVLLQTGLHHTQMWAGVLLPPLKARNGARLWEERHKPGEQQTLISI